MLGSDIRKQPLRMILITEALQREVRKGGSARQRRRSTHCTSCPSPQTTPLHTDCCTVSTLAVSHWDDSHPVSSVAGLRSSPLAGFFAAGVGYSPATSLA